MIIFVDGHKFHYETENLCRVFFPFDNIKVLRENCDWQVYTGEKKEKGEYTITVSLKFEDYNKTLTASLAGDTPDDERELKMATLLYTLLTEYTGYTPKWGLLTGVRPSKLMNSLIEKDGPEEAKKYFMDSLLVSEDKTLLAATVAKAEKEIMERSEPESFSLYVSVPFCPTRCSYCSFVSHSVKAAAKLIPEYTELLCKELSIFGKIASELGLKLETVYYGGGTPTTLSPEQLQMVGEIIENSFDLSTVSEYTVEAGRPDTITEEKLRVLKALGVSRISINPQTFEEHVLKKIGRCHTGAQTEEAFSLARKIGFDNINMDLIAGLPDDTVEGFGRTLKKVTSLDPEGVTVHTLALKRSSEIVTGGELVKTGSMVAAMLDDAQKVLSEKYSPYYMYRQSRCLGNLENVGWCKEGFEGLYNIYMMEECHSVFAAGAGAVTKLKQPRGKYIERIFNYKYPFEYNSRFDELMKRKERIKTFYGTY